VALAVVARNVQRLGAVLRERERLDPQKADERWRRRQLKKRPEFALKPPQNPDRNHQGWAGALERHPHGH
jgi:hypothetical protein